ncbi:MAG TPA: O-antigen ligase family protein [Bryobacteraceae bacterium]|nr:O-antigen ligase family protein [Bryobacteraceae bacterium]
MPTAAFYLACGAAVTSLVSIAACQTLLGAALLLLILSRRQLEFPPILLPLGIFVALTLISLAFSSDPRAGLPQVVKFYVFLMLPVIYTAIRRVSDIRKLVWWWAAAASASGIWSFGQFWLKRQRALAQHNDFYAAYVGDRVTGFVGHWMTFGAAQMAALLLLLAVLLFAGPKRYRGLTIGAALLITASIVIGWTRSVWLATAVSSTYLVAVWRPKFLLFAPLLLLLGWFVSPRSVRQRVISIYQPNEQVDSNRHRYITFRTGVEMIKAHPVLGIGPEMPGKLFEQYVPSDIRRPLPEGFYGHLHNVYLQYAAERGIPALLVFLWMIAKMAWDWWRSALSTTDPQRRAILHGCLAVLLAVLIEGFFEHNLGDSEILSMFWIVVAWGYTARRVEA